MKQVNGKYFYQRKLRRCPVCGGKEIATYYFGFPKLEFALQAQNNDLIILAGCSLDAPEQERAWHCNECGEDFYFEYQQGYWEKKWKTFHRQT